MRTAILAVILAMSTLTPGVAADRAPAGLKAGQIGEIFCLSRVGDDEGPIEGLLSPDLAAVIADARHKDADWARANPGDKPPLGDGIPWAAWPDFAPVCTVGLVALMKTDARVELKYGFPDQPDADFADTLILKRVARDDAGSTVWRIDNVAYATGGDLRAALAAAFAD